MRLFIDSETTEVFNFKRPPSDPCQPHIVQLGAILHDEERRVVAEMNLLVKPEGWTIPEEATKIHGISTERCLKYGFKIATVMKLLSHLLTRADELVGHSLDFDKNMCRAEYQRLGYLEDEAAMLAKPSYCTMKASTDILKLPGPFGGHKWPKLQETYKHFFSKEFEGAHDAQADIRATAEIYYPIKEFLAKGT